MRENHPMAASSVLAFWAVALLLIVVPGPDWAFVLGSGVRGRSAIPAVAGLVLGYGAVTVVVAAGVGALVARSPVLLTGLIFVGGMYLVWLGARTLARSKAPDALTGAGHGGDGQPGTGRASTDRANTGRANTGRANTGPATLARGMGVSALNPKGLLLFVALLPQFTSPRWSWPLAAQLGLLGLVFVVNCAAFYLCLGMFARRILHARPAAALALTRFSGAAMIAIGALLLIERLAA
jgi:threonine/homoserine/homoserine lactone efflux protein